VIDQVAIHRLVQSKDREERRRAVEILKINYYVLNDKKQAWDDLIRLTQDNNDYVRWSAADSLGSCYPHLPEEYKKQAWDDLHRLMQDNNDYVLVGAADSLGSCYSHLPEEYKKQAWDDLIRLVENNDDDVLRAAADSLGSCYSYLPEEYKKQAWDDLIRLTKDNDNFVLSGAADSLGSCYSYLPEEYKKQAWDDLHKLTQDNDIDVLRAAADSLGSCYSHLPEEYKKQAWDDLIRLVENNDDYVLRAAADSLGSCYSHLPEEYKKQAWDDLHRLTKDNDIAVLMGAIDSLGSCYSYLPEEYKKQAWDDLHRLTKDKDKYVSVAANHSLGRVSIYRASQAKSDESVREELETALRFFEKASNESIYNPARFCLPFYRSFHAITFKKEEAEAEVKQYIAEAKKAIEGSESKENLFEAVENLGNALKEAQKARDLNDVKYDLNTYRLYCERAADMMDETENKAPGATRLLRKGLPIIDKKIKQILAEIQQSANTACKQSKGTPTEELACKINQEVQKWQISDQEQMAQNITNLIFTLKAKIPLYPANNEIYENIEKIGKEKDLIKQYQLIVILIALIPQTLIGGIMTHEYIGGDKIVANNSSLVIKSSFSNAINNIKESRNDEIAKAIEDLARLIENANFENRKETMENLESLAEEAAKQNPRKGTMRVLGDSILNSVQKVSEIVEKVSPLIKIISKLWL
jgi:HEAT repeat protein